MYALIDNIYDICNESQERVRYYLVELLFVKLHELEDFCKETDEYFENYGQLTDETTSFEGVDFVITDTDGKEIDKEFM